MNISFINYPMFSKGNLNCEKREECQHQNSRRIHRLPNLYKCTFTDIFKVDGQHKQLKIVFLSFQRSQFEWTRDIQKKTVLLLSIVRERGLYSPLNYRHLFLSISPLKLSYICRIVNKQVWILPLSAYLIFKPFYFGARIHIPVCTAQSDHPEWQSFMPLYMYALHILYLHSSLLSHFHISCALKNEEYF